LYTNLFNSDRELETIARRYDFEPLYDQRVTSGNSAKWTNAGVVFSNKTIDSGLTSIHHTGLQFLRRIICEYIAI
jgi:hypothetical protein